MSKEMNKIKVGKVANTHGIKGELRILTNFERPELVFKPGFKLYIDNEEYVIKTYRKHKNFRMVTLNDFKNINEVLFLKHRSVFINREDLEDNDLALDLIDYKVYNNATLLGEVIEVIPNKMQTLLKVSDGNEEFYVPYVEAFIQDINHEQKLISLHHWEGLK